LFPNKKIIQNIYFVERFGKIFSVYFKVVTPIVIIISILGVTTFRAFLRNLENLFFSEIFSLILIVVVSSSIAFIGYMLYILLLEKKNKWIVLFVSMVLIPYLFLHLTFQQFMYFKINIAFIPVILYYIYCFMLKHNIEKWISEYYWHQSRTEVKRLKEEMIKKDNILL